MRDDRFNATMLLYEQRDIVTFTDFAKKEEFLYISTVNSSITIFLLKNVYKKLSRNT